MILKVIGLLCLCTLISVAAASSNSTKPSRKAKQGGLGVFSVVRFPNTACTASNNVNGSCYTAEECSSKAGTAATTCASGFGVCCVFYAGCGSTMSENSTYHIKTSYSVTTDPSPCTYTICPANTDVCKLRLDFQIFDIAPPATVTTTSAATTGVKTGVCLTDTFTVAVKGSASPPVICGLNTGQHMYVDATSDCAVLSFNIDTGTTTSTRQWNFQVTQIDCTQEDGIQDCLQYHTGTGGTFANFNYDTTVTAVTLTDNIHLSDQSYDICFRRERGYCKICYAPYIGTAINSFSIGAAGDKGALEGSVDTLCTGITGAGYGDYVEIVNMILNPASTQSSTTNGANRICGNIFNGNAAQAKTAIKTLCSYHTPFRWGVNFDHGEIIIATPCAAAIANTCENVAGGGVTGFHMHYWQVAC